MSVLLTGSAGFIGRAVMNALLKADYHVTALVDSQEDALAAQAAGAETFFASEEDTRTVSELALESNGVIHTATAPGEDADFIKAIIPGLLTSDKPFVYTGSLWTYGSNLNITEKSPQVSVPAIAWMIEMQKYLMGELSTRTIVVAPGIVYGHGQGIPRHFVDDVDRTGPTPVLPLIGDGSQHWATVHVDDLADLYVRIIGEESHTNEVYIATSEANETVADLTSAAAATMNATVKTENSEATAKRFGPALAALLLLDQHAASDRARERLGWKTAHPSLMDELKAGYLHVPDDALWE